MDRGFIIPVAVGIFLVSGAAVVSTQKWVTALDQADLAFQAADAGGAEPGAPSPPGFEPAPAAYEELKRDFIAAAGAGQLHNEVFAAVGERRWEDNVKPAFVQWVLTNSTADLGTPVPTDEQLLQWVRDHRAEAQDYLRSLKP